jgi:ribosome-binding factor A
MANEKNLIPQAHILTVEEQSAGGKKSAQARREKKTVQKILADLLDSEIKDSPQFAKLASKMGVESDKSVKDIFTMVCLLNTVKNGNLGDLERLSKLLGEDKQNENADVLSKLDKVIGEVDKLAE